MLQKKVKAKVIVEGNVQGVGYKALVRQTARNLRIEGFVRNLKDGTVGIFCEGSRNDIEKFLKKIKVKGDPENVFTLDVSKIKCYWEGKTGYVEPKEKYEGFEIDHSIELKRGFDKSVMDEFDYGKYYLSDSRGILKDFRNQTKDSFNVMSKKYSRISSQLKGMKDVHKEIKLLRKDLHKEFKFLVDSMGKILKKALS